MDGAVRRLLLLLAHQGVTKSDGHKGRKEGVQDGKKRQKEEDLKRKDAKPRE